MRERITEVVLPQKLYRHLAVSTLELWIADHGSVVIAFKHLLLLFFCTR